MQWLNAHVTGTKREALKQIQELLPQRGWDKEYQKERKKEEERKEREKKEDERRQRMEERRKHIGYKMKSVNSQFLIFIFWIH